MVRKPWLQWTLESLALAALVFAVWRDLKFDDWRGAEQPSPRTETAAVQYDVGEVVRGGLVQRGLSILPGVYAIRAEPPEGPDFSSLLPHVGNTTRFLTEQDPVHLLVFFPEHWTTPPEKVKFSSVTREDGIIRIEAEIGATKQGERPDVLQDKQPLKLIDLGRLPPGGYRVRLTSTGKRPDPHGSKPLHYRQSFYVNPGPGQAWSDEVGGLRARLLLHDQRVAFGGNVHLLFQLRNETGAPITLSGPGGLFQDIWPGLRRSDGGVVPVVPAVPPQRDGSVSKTQIAPGDIKAFPVTFSTRTGFVRGALPPGQYELTLWYGLSSATAVKYGCAKCWSGVVAAPPVPVAILPPPRDPR